MLWWASIVRVADAYPGPLPFAAPMRGEWQYLRMQNDIYSERFGKGKLAKGPGPTGSGPRRRSSRGSPASAALLCAMVGRKTFAARPSSRDHMARRRHAVSRRRATRLGAAAGRAGGSLLETTSPGASAEDDRPQHAIRPRAGASADLGRRVAVDLERERNLNHLRRLPGHDPFLQLDRPCASLSQYVEPHIANQAISDSEQTNGVSCDARRVLGAAVAGRPATAAQGPGLTGI